jgi:son of sevenless
MAVLAGITSVPIRRLKQTWEIVSPEMCDHLVTLEALLKSDGNFKLLRRSIQDATPPCIPYVGMSLSDLVFIEGM